MIDRKNIDQLLEDMDIFHNLKEHKAKYYKEVFKLTNKENELRNMLDGLQQELTANLMERDISDDVSLVINLSIQSTEINSKIDLIQSMLDDIQGEKAQIKLKYAPVLHEVVKKERQAFVNKYDLTPIVADIRYQMLSMFSDLGKATEQQYNELATFIYEIIEDDAVKRAYPSMGYSFHIDNFRPIYTENQFPTVINKNDIHASIHGTINYPKPEVKDNGK